MSRQRSRSALVIVAALACVALSGPFYRVSACTGALVTFEKIRVGAQRIVIGTLVEADLNDGVAERVTLRVEAVVRGVSGPEVVLEPPTFMGCDGRIMEPVGSELLVATGPRYFGVGPAVEMHPYWRVLEGDVLEAVGVDDVDPDHTRLAGLVADLGGVAITSPEPAAVAEPDSPADRGALPLAIAVATMLAAVALFTGAWRLARRRQ